MDEQQACIRYETRLLLCPHALRDTALSLLLLLAAVFGLIFDAPDPVQAFAFLMLCLSPPITLVFLVLHFTRPAATLRISDSEVQYSGPIKKIRFRFGEIRRTVLSTEPEASNWGRLSFELRNGDSLILAPGFIHENDFELLKFLSRQGLRLDPESGGERFLRKAGLQP